MPRPPTGIGSTYLYAGKTELSRRNKEERTPAHVGMVGKKEETVGDGINKAIRDLNAATFSGNVIPNIIKLEFDSRGKPVGH